MAELNKWSINRNISLWHLIGIAGLIVSGFLYGVTHVFAIDNQVEKNKNDIAYHTNSFNLRLDKLEVNNNKRTDKLESKIDKIYDLLIKRK